MQFTRPPRRRPAESVVPMINVVFLLLIFFMMSSRIAPAPPFDLTLPVSESSAVLEEDAVLFISADGIAVFRGITGVDVWTTLQGVNKEQRLTIRADAGLPTPELAAILARLAGMGITTVDLALRAQ